MKNGFIYLIETDGCKMAGKYDSKINALRNLKKPSLFLSILPTDKILGEWENVTAYRNAN